MPKQPLDIKRLVARIKELYELQKNVVIVCGEGIVDPNGNELGVEKQTHDPPGNIMLSGASSGLQSCFSL